MAPWSSAACGQRTLAPTAVAAGQAVTLRRSSFTSQVSVPLPARVLRAPWWSGLARGPEPGHPYGRGTRVLPLAQASWWQGPWILVGPGWRSCCWLAPFLHVSPAGLMAHPSFHSLVPPGLMTGGDTAVLSETETRHLAQTRDPSQGHSPQDPSLGAGTGGPGAIASAHPRPRTR